MAQQVVGRFAPTPSGQLHLGNLFCSLIAWLAAKSQGGKILLRSEDLDVERSRPEYALQAQRDLEALGLFWDEGGDRSGPHAPYDQSQRFPFYRTQLERLESQRLVYPCFCSRAQLHAASAPHASDGETIYAGTCRGLSPKRRRNGPRPAPPALRLRVPEETIAFTDLHYGPQQQYLPTGCGDFILRRSDGVYAYQLAVVADDGAMGVTQVGAGAGPAALPPPGRSCCTGCWAGLCRNLATRPCSWRRGAGGFPSGTATSAFPGCWKRG